MKRELLELLACPGCRAAGLSAAPLSEGGREITEGLVRCPACGAEYPVINSIPRMLPAKLQPELLNYHAEFFERHRGKVRPPEASGAASDASDALKRKTIKSFSFQWNVFSEMFDEYVKHWESYIPDAADAEFFRGKTGLDAGCGFGRHIYRAAGSGARMVGMDLSEACEAAYKNTSHMDNVHIVQGDIYNPPFPKGAFDFVYSLGVLHHLPDPEGGFESLTGLLEKGQKIFVWCYDDDKPRKNRMYEAIRKHTTRMDFNSLYVFCLLSASAVRVGLNWPAAIAKLLPGMKDKKFSYDYYNNFPFRVLHADLFDVFSVPSTRYYNQADIDAWFTRHGIRITESAHKVSGWTVLGEK